VSQGRRLALLAGAAALAAAIVAVAIVIGQGGADDDESDSPPAPPAQQAEEARGLFEGIPQDGIALGEPDAPATLIEFADLQCPFCAEFAVQTAPEVIDRYVRDGRLRLELRLLTFLGPDSVRGAQVAHAAALQDRLWPFTELFFQNQGPENSGYATDAFLERLARRTPGLDTERLSADFGNAEVTALARAATRLGDRLGVEGTPTFYVVKDGGAPEPLDVDSLDPGRFIPLLDETLGGG
jgi:protein-disulfide isomerase